MIESIQKGDADRRREALDRIARLYWRPVYWTIRRRWRASPEEARDLTQVFFLRFLDRGLIMKARRENGRFRAWIKAALGNFMREEFRCQTALKRGGGTSPVPLEDLLATESAPPSPDDAPDRIFEQQLVKAMIDEALERSANRAAALGRSTDFEIFRTYYFEDAQGRRPTYEALAERFGVGYHDVKNGLAAMRLAYRAELLDLVGSTTKDTREAWIEIMELFGR